jgi:hypothetical protein
MRKLALVLALMTVPVLAAPNAYLIVPCVGFGPYHASYGMDGLKRRCQGDEAWGEGGSGAAINFMHPSTRVSLTAVGRRVRTMDVHGFAGRWHTRDGIRLGTPLSTLVRLNGRSFHFRSGSFEVIDRGEGA